ncbi:MAG TPA: lipopolysaccharide biosynthesis protein [Myxococcota bacterium]|nr:lipopolysaccharide biosynthesis protein [Myxococcota bacterium]
MNFARNASSTALTQVVRGLFGFVFGVLIARWLSEADRGVFAVVATVGVFAEHLSHLGMRFTVIYRMTRPAGSRPRAVGAALEWTVLAFAVICALAWLFAAPLRERVLLGAEPLVLGLALALAAADLFSGLSDAVARGIDRFDLRNANQIAIPLVSLAAGAVALLGLGCGLVGTLVAVAAARLALLAGMGALTLRQSGLEWTLDGSELGESLRFGVKGWLQVLLAKVHERVDVVVMALLRLDPVQIAVYAIAVNVVDRLRVVPEAVSASLLPTLATMEPERTGEYTARVTRHTVVWVAASGAALALLAPLLLPFFYGERYAPAVAPFLVLLPATAMLTVRTMVSNYFIAVGRPGFNAWVQAGAVCANVAANLFAIPRWGIVGAAAASVLSYGVETVATVLAFRRAAQRSLRDTLVPSRGDLADYAGQARRLRERLGGA